MKPEFDNTKWREVDQEEFYNAFAKKDCHPSIEGFYPYTSYFNTPGSFARSGITLGIKKEFLPRKNGFPQALYLLPRK